MPPFKKKYNQIRPPRCGFSVRLNAKQTTQITGNFFLIKHHTAITQNPMAGPAGCANIISIVLLATNNPSKKTAMPVVSTLHRSTTKSVATTNKAALTQSQIVRANPQGIVARGRIKNNAEGG